MGTVYLRHVVVIAISSVFWCYDGSANYAIFFMENMHFCSVKYSLL